MYDYSFADHFLNFGILFVNFISNHDLSHNIHWLLYLDVNVSRAVNFYYSLLEYWNIYYFLYLNYLWNNLNSLNNFLNYLRYFNDLLYDSRHNYYLFNYFLNLYHFRHLHKFLNYLLYDCWDCFDSFYNLFYRNDSIFDNFNNLRLFNEVIHDSINLFYSVLIKDFGFFYFYFLVNQLFHDLNYRLLYDLSLNFNYLMNQWNLHNFLYYLLNSSILYNWLFYNLLYFLYPVSI